MDEESDLLTEEESSEMDGESDPHFIDFIEHSNFLCRKKISGKDDKNKNKKNPKIKITPKCFKVEHIDITPVSQYRICGKITQQEELRRCQRVHHGGFTIRENQIR